MAPVLEGHVVNFYLSLPGNADRKITMMNTTRYLWKQFTTRTLSAACQSTKNWRAIQWSSHSVLRIATRLGLFQTSLI